MNAGVRIVIFAILVFKISVVSNGQSFSLSSATSSNTFAANSNSAVTNAAPRAKISYFERSAEHSTSSNQPPFPRITNNIPLIEFEDVPVTVAWENLARQAEINYILDPQIGYGQPDENGQIRPEPTISLTWKNITAEQGFVSLCKVYNLTVVRDTNTGVVLVRKRGHDVNYMDATFYGNNTNNIPVIEFQEVPILTVLRNLARQAGMKCIFSKRFDSSQSPLLSFRWENITATQAFAAVCENYDLNAYRLPLSGNVEVEPP